MLRTSLYLTALFLVAAVRLAAEDAPVPPAPPAPAYGDSANDLSLALYQQLQPALEAALAAKAKDLAAWLKAQSQTDVELDPKTGKLTPRHAADRPKTDAEKKLEDLVAANHAAILKALGAAQTIHRTLAAKCLAFSTEKAAVLEAVGKTLAQDPDLEVRACAVFTLMQFKDVAAVPALLAGLEDQNDGLRGRVATALGTLKDSRSLPPLLAHLVKDEKATVRMRCAQALGEIKDSSTLEPLQKAMDEEQDYRVRMAIAVAIRGLRGQDTPATEGVPSEEDHLAELAKLQKDMDEIKEKLRSDRHDQKLQGEEKDVEKKLTAMIEKVEQQMQQQQQQQQQKQQQQQQQAGGQKPSSQKQPSSPMQNSQAGGAAQSGALNPVQVLGEQAAWARLPSAMRDDILQGGFESMPERWRRRVMAYFWSINAEENKK